jgi:hypothetical protein
MNGQDGEYGAKGGRDALELASAYGHEAVVALLLQNMAIVNAQGVTL